MSALVCARLGILKSIKKLEIFKLRFVVLMSVHEGSCPRLSTSIIL